LEPFELPVLLLLLLRRRRRRLKLLLLAKRRLWVIYCGGMPMHWLQSFMLQLRSCPLLLKFSTA